jgi:hypothetical protein
MQRAETMQWFRRKFSFSFSFAEVSSRLSKKKSVLFLQKTCFELELSPG